MKKYSTLLSAAFLMATSAIGPGFLTQTTVLTQKIGYSFAFGILLSIMIDIVAQTSIWRVLGFSKLRATIFGNKVLPFFGTAIAILVAFGGFVFNIGNASGAGLGMEASFGISPQIGALLSSIFVLIIFNSKKSMIFLDYVVKIMGVIMLALIFSMLFLVKIDWFLLLKSFIWPDRIDSMAILTIIGGTVGGYISFAGIHRLLEAGISGEENLNKIDKSASFGIILTGICRIFLFIGTLGVVSAGNVLLSDNPTSSVFLVVFGTWGKLLFGIMIWFAAITSLIGATFTSITFLIDVSPYFEKYKKIIAILFIAVSTLIFVLIGKPVNLLLYAGYFNSFVLPFALIMVLWGLKKSFMKDYKHPKVLIIGSLFVICLMLYFSVSSILK
jgi:Mn2+/Fe2+ NRAMP family transporter